MNSGSTPAPKSRVGRIMDTFDSNTPGVQEVTPAKPLLLEAPK